MPPVAIAIGILITAFILWRLSKAINAVTTGLVIFDYIEKGDFAKVRQVIETCPNAVNVRDSEGQIPLHAAASLNVMDVSEFLIANGAELNARRNNGASPLHLAAHGGHTNAVSLLLEHGADPNAVGGKGITPLHMAAAMGHMDIVGRLLTSGANRQLKDEWGQTPRDWAIQIQRLDIAELLV